MTDELPVDKPQEVLDAEAGIRRDKNGRVITPAMAEARARNLAKGTAAQRQRKGQTKKSAEKKPASTSNKPETPPEKSDEQLKREARDSIRRWRAELGTVGLAIAPIPATYVLRTDDEVIEAAVRLAGKNARIMGYLASGGDVLAALILARWAAGLGVAVGVQYGQIAPDSSVALNLGVTTIVADLAAEGVISMVAADGTPQTPEVVSADASDLIDDARSSRRPSPIVEPVP